MISDQNDAVSQAKELIEIQDGLSITLKNDKHVIVEGTVLVNRTAKKYHLYREYKIKIVIPFCSHELPYVIDKGNHIDENYEHIYPDGSLCLETDTSIRIRFIDGFSLSTWYIEYVEAYFFSYEYYQRYGLFPFDERAHGAKGIIQTYGDFFNETDSLKVLSLMKSIITQQYRGHMPCPCGSKKRTRSCHGLELMRFYTDERLKGFILGDFKLMEAQCRRYEQLKNSM